MAPPSGLNGRSPREGLALCSGRWAQFCGPDASPGPQTPVADAERADQPPEALVEHFDAVWDAVLDAFKSFVETAPASDDAERMVVPSLGAATQRLGREPLTYRSKVPMNFAEFSKLPQLSDEDFLAARENLRPYTCCILKRGPNFEPPGPDYTVGVTRVIWAHGKRNTALHQAGLLPIVCPISDDGDIAGVGVFNATLDQVHEIMSADPAVKAQVLTYEVHVTRSFVGSTLPDAEVEEGKTSS